jgi:hypothetical protein
MKKGVKENAELKTKLAKMEEPLKNIQMENVIKYIMMLIKKFTILNKDINIFILYMPKI